jgi:hypothetical protein
MVCGHSADQGCVWTPRKLSTVLCLQRAVSDRAARASPCGGSAHMIFGRTPYPVRRYTYLSTSSAESGTKEMPVGEEGRRQRARSGKARAAAVGERAPMM